MGVLSELPESYRILALLLLGVSIFFLNQRTTRSKANFPFVGVRSSDFVSLFFGGFKFVNHAKSMLSDGYSKYQDRPFQVPTYTTNAKLIIPPKHIEELRNYSDAKLSFSSAAYESLQGETLGLHILAENNQPQVKMVRSQLTSNLAKLIDPIIDESKFAFDAEIGPAKEWKSIHVHSAAIRTIARISSRIFVGEELCRNDEWLHISIKFTEDVFGNSFLMISLPRFLRPLVRFISPFHRRVHRHRVNARKLLGPVYEQRLEGRAADKPKVEDTFGWMVSNAQPRWRNVDNMVDFHLFLGMVAIHTTTAALDAMLYDLAARPEYIEPLREEITQAVSEDGGQLKKSTLAKMLKLDSFMKESQRVNSNLITFNRKVLQPIDLSDGTHIPAGTNLATAAGSMNFDPRYYENPEEFDGFRFYKLRQQAGEFNKHQFVSTSPSDINFGYGSHACAGRFFAANEIQVVLVRFLMKYDFKYPEGEGRPENWALAEATIQDLKRSMMVRERSDVPDWDFL